MSSELSLQRTPQWTDNEYLNLPYQHGMLHITKKRKEVGDLKLPGTRLTTAGMELYSVVHPTVNVAYLQIFSMFLSENGYKLEFLEGIQPLPGDRFSFTNRTLIEPETPSSAQL